jgi:hypothetical protein
MPVPYDVNRKNYLLDRFRDDQIDVKDAIELRNLLEQEKDEASSIGDLILVFSISMLLVLVADYISKEKSILRSISGFFFPKHRRRKNK